ncbi:YihY/virulence factor BrkB family protein [Microbacterium stercoris]|uniref:YihY/virulence factor BrkB family protein n=1 Tax=Microbacterium stercoris TaxID=2820289 RepID=A0A939QGJ9_9MICO|nr:YihY/virulence factor BrkB family protein [Microbacterium stercoris]MBO3662373.1 YihY/virulence factor BrkB family protein [Microbacterium stercoris]MBO3664365.1 YihY/virulence factor BrkB family protein [Microbacterium stercoris]
MSSTAGREAPDAKPSLSEIHRLSWWFVAKKTVREFIADQCRDLAAGLTFYSVLSLLPAIVAVLSLLGVIGQDKEAVTAVLQVLQEANPDAAQWLRGPLEELSRSSGVRFALGGGIVILIWTASLYVSAFARALNRIWETPEGRPFWKLKGSQLLVTVLAIALVSVGAVLLLIGGDFAVATGSALGIGETGLLVWRIVRWPALVIVVTLFVALLYYFTPNSKQPRFRWVSVGALIAIVALALASAGFALYVSSFSQYERAYGSLAGIVILLLWMWIANGALLFGAQFDAELERARELQAGIPAEHGIQLPPRDTTVIEKRAAQEAKDQADARRIRHRP